MKKLFIMAIACTVYLLQPPAPAAGAAQATGRISPPRVSGAAESDISAVVRGMLDELLVTLKAAVNTAPDTMTKYHYKDMISRIAAITEGKSNS